MEDSPAIKIEDLTVRFDGRTILSHFQLDLAPGAKATLTGRSGSGKSTVLRCILGFAVPDEGSIHIRGERLTDESVWHLRTGLAYVAQEPDLGTGRVSEIIERPFEYRANAPLRDNLSRTPELFDRFLLSPGLLDSDIAKLSGGEKQRVAIISSILLGRSIFLLDEATSALDKIATRAMADFFRSSGDLTVLTVSHDPGKFGFPDHIIELPGGGPP